MEPSMSVSCAVAERASMVWRARGFSPVFCRRSAAARRRAPRDDRVFEPQCQLDRTLRLAVSSGRDGTSRRVERRVRRHVRVDRRRRGPRARAPHRARATPRPARGWKLVVIVRDDDDGSSGDPRPSARDPRRALRRRRAGPRPRPAKRRARVRPGHRMRRPGLPVRYRRASRGWRGARKLPKALPTRASRRVASRRRRSRRRRRTREHRTPAHHDRTLACRGSRSFARSAERRRISLIVQ